MASKLKVTGLVLGGYLLGRTKKLGLALTIASAVAGSKAVTNRDKIMETLNELSESSPELKELGEKITGRLADSGRSAATAFAAKGADRLSGKLQEQTDKLNASMEKSSAGASGEAEEEPSAADEASEDEQSEDAPANEAEDASSEEPEEESEEAPAEEAPAEEESEETPAEEAPAEEEPKKPARRRSSGSGTRSSGSGTKSSGGSRSTRSRSTSSRSKSPASGSRAKRSTSGSKSSSNAASKTKEDSDE